MKCISWLISVIVNMIGVPHADIAFPSHKFFAIYAENSVLWILAEFSVTTF
uniref:Uncharacterized protein n=1 Tax=Rhizophora mucronata TaxID=61149 RepID=A0A2P2JTE0_RHIMU